jgi:hypothetical protein
MMYILYSLTSFICFLGYFIVILRLFLLRWNKRKKIHID